MSLPTMFGQIVKFRMCEFLSYSLFIRVCHFQEEEDTKFEDRRERENENLAAHPVIPSGSERGQTVDPGADTSGHQTR